MRTENYSMKKIRTQLLSKEGIVSHPVLFVSILMLGLILTDPFQMGPLGGMNFRPTKLALPPYKQVMRQWPRDNQSRLKFGRLEFVDEVYGPESIDFDPEGNGPYSGLADGRIVRWMGQSIGWETFAFVSANWTENVCAKGVESTTTKQYDYETQCGRPLGLRFNRYTGDLYIADAYFGLMVVGPKGGLATSLATHVHGKPILFANDLDIHPNGSVYFTDTSMRYNRQNHFFILLETEATGRLLRYDPHTNSTHVVISGLTFPNGVQISQDQSFLLYTETTSCRVTKYWLEGPKAGETELFANLPGFPDNVRMNDKGQFWVAIDCCRTPTQQVLSNYPWLRSLYFKLPLKLKYLAKKTGMKRYTVAALFNGNFILQLSGNLQNRFQSPSLQNKLNPPKTDFPSLHRLHRSDCISLTSRFSSQLRSRFCPASSRLLQNLYPHPDLWRSDEQRNLTRVMSKRRT